MWGDSIVGFGTYHYRYKSGPAKAIGPASASPRASNTSPIYIMPGFGEYEALLSRLGKTPKPAVLVSLRQQTRGC